MSRTVRRVGHFLREALMGPSERFLSKIDQRLPEPEVPPSQVEQAVPHPPLLSANKILRSLYSPPHYHVDDQGTLTWSSDISPERSADNRLPLPPPGPLRMDHSDNDEEYLFSGEASATVVRNLLKREGLDIANDAFVMEWGCAAGRVLRHFAPEAWHGHFWGVDQDGPSLVWAKDNLWPPFRFLTCTAYPHLPFEDNTFTLVYGLSVFTHIFDLLDNWLMEFRRILAPGGYALFTVHDEHTWQLIQTDENLRRYWTQSEYIRPEDLDQDLDHDVTVFSAHGEWDTIVTFFGSDWIAREWSQYLDVVSIEACLEGYQTMVVLKKPSFRGLGPK